MQAARFDQYLADGVLISFRMISRILIRQTDTWQVCYFVSVEIHFLWDCRAALCWEPHRQRARVERQQDLWLLRNPVLAFGSYAKREIRGQGRQNSL